MSKNRETLLKAYPATPDVVSKRMDETLDKLYHSMPHRTVRRWSAALVAALMLSVVSLGVAAGIHFGVFDFMSQFFGHQVLPEAAELVQQPEATIELAHTIITAEEVVYDGGVLRMVYSIRAKDGAVMQAAEADQLNLDGCDWLWLDGQEYTMPSGAYSYLLADDENNRLLCYLDIPVASAGFVPDTAFLVELPMADAKLSFAVEPSVKNRPPVQKDAGAAMVTLQNASASAVRVYAQIHVQRQPEADPDAFIETLGGWTDAVLTDVEGNIIGKPEHVQTMAEVEGESLTLSYTFLPTDAQELWMAPTTFTENDEWKADMEHAFCIR